MAAPQQRPEIKIKLTVVKGPHVGQVFQLGKDSFTIGRGPENNVVLLNDPQVSRSHAQVKVINNEVEISNLSQKNAVIVDGASVQRWKLLNQATFTIGDSEIKVEYDFGQAVVSIPNPKLAEVLPLKPVNQEASGSEAVPPVAEVSALPSDENLKPTADSDVGPQALGGAAVKPNIQASQLPTAKKAGQKSKKVGAPALRSQQVSQRPRTAQPYQQPGRPPGPLQPQFGQMPQGPYDINAQYRAGQNKVEKNDSLMASPMFKFVMVALIMIGAAYSYLATPTQKSQAQKIARTLKYEDEVATRLYSKKEKEQEVDRDYRYKISNSAQALRVNEHFIRGLRDYQAGNYVRAMDSFQLVLNLDPDHAQAKRHLYLSRVRFDEILQAKLMLGESYYTKHNFRMCAAMYKQVMHMLEGRNNDQKYLLSEKKAKECDLASQGIR